MGLPTDSGELDGLQGNRPVFNFDLSGLLSRSTLSLVEPMGGGAVCAGGEGSRGFVGFQGILTPLVSWGVFADAREGERDLENMSAIMLRGPLDGGSIED